MATKKTPSSLPAILFDADGTLIDSVYEHVAAWSLALRAAGIVLPSWKLHRRIGMSGKSFLRELFREIERPQLSSTAIQKLEKTHGDEFSKRIGSLNPLPGAGELLKYLSSRKVRWAIASTGKAKQTHRLLRSLAIPSTIPVVTGDDVSKTKPSPDAFVLASERLGVEIRDCIVVGDSVWDLLAAVRKSALGVGMLSGGYSQEELERAGAFRVYQDPGDLLAHLEQLGIPGSE